MSEFFHEAVVFLSLPGQQHVPKEPSDAAAPRWCSHAQPSPCKEGGTSSAVLSPPPELRDPIQGAAPGSGRALRAGAEQGPERLFGPDKAFLPSLCSSSQVDLGINSVEKSFGPDVKLALA